MTIFLAFIAPCWSRYVYCDSMSCETYVYGISEPSFEGDDNSSGRFIAGSYSFCNTMDPYCSSFCFNLFSRYVNRNSGDDTLLPCFRLIYGIGLLSI